MFLHDHPIVESDILSSWANSHQVPKLWQTCRAFRLNCYTGKCKRLKHNRHVFSKTQNPLNGCKMGVDLERRERVMRYLMIRFLQKIDPLCFWNKYLSIKNLWSAQKSRLAILPDPIRPLCLSQHLTCKSVGVDVIYQTTPQRVRNQNTTSFVAVI